MRSTFRSPTARLTPARRAMMFIFLDALFGSCLVDMRFATELVQLRFGILDRALARDVLVSWLVEFRDRLVADPDIEHGHNELVATWAGCEDLVRCAALTCPRVLTGVLTRVGCDLIARECRALPRDMTEMRAALVRVLAENR